MENAQSDNTDLPGKKIGIPIFKVRQMETRA